MTTVAPDAALEVRVSESAESSPAASSARATEAAITAFISIRAATISSCRSRLAASAETTPRNSATSSSGKPYPSSASSRAESRSVVEWRMWASACRSAWVSAAASRAPRAAIRLEVSAMIRPSAIAGRA